MKRTFFGAVAVAAVALTLVFIGSAGAAKPPPTGNGGCPSGSLSNYPTSGIVGYSVTNDAGNTTSTYKFFSQNQNPTGGVPGLQGYCVYTATAPKSDTTTGGDVPTWKASKPAKSFGFTRPGGESTNIPLDGKTYTVGFATWANGSAPAPAAQQILLHLSGSAAAVCNGLPSCYVRPTQAPPCSTGDSTVAYNAMPSDVVNCVNPGIGFEAQSVSEFGNAVNLSSSAGSNLASFNMDMQSFACQTGHWNGNPDDSSNTVEPCQFTDSTNPTFQWPVTANIYAVNGDGSPGALLATSGPVNQTIPYRPAHDGTGHCANLDNNSNSGNRWWNPAALGGAGACQSSIATVLSFSSFTAPGGGAVAPLPGQVIWTVSFATTDNGTTVSPPQGVQACSSGPDLRFPGLADGGCPYDSLNPGDNGNSGGTDFPASHITNAPYAGSDVTTGVAYLNQGGTGLQSQTGWAGLRPLGEIITSP